MEFRAGARFGAYEILALAGAGGMGQVYRARDTRLGRTVALKFLSGALTTRPDTFERLKREAQVVSRLNHAHICALYDIGEQDDITYLVMEFVAGETLADRLARGPLPLEESLRYGAQMADALDAAHREGIVHRDLKPRNVMLTRDGVKLLDFGLAKLCETEGQLRGMRTTIGRISEEGVLVGTLAYMAPEQLEGKDVDARTDLFALGVVLHEMTSGRHPFERGSKASLISAILTADPPPLPARTPLTPAPFERAIVRCLAKDPHERWQTARDLSAELKWILETAPGRAASSRDIVANAWRPGLAAGTRAARVALVALAIVAVGLAVWRMWPRDGQDALPHNFRLVSTFPGIHRSATFSPDGNMIAFISDAEGVPQVWVRNLTGGEPIRITEGDVAASHPRWSIGNDRIVFGRRRQGIWSVPPLGGAVRQIVEQGTNPSLSKDGSRLVFERERQIWIAGADGLNARRVEGVPRGFYSVDLAPAISPDGRLIAFFVAELGPNGDLWIISTDGGTPRRLTNDVREGGAPSWTPDGKAIIFASARGGSRTLWRISPDGGLPTPVTTGAGEEDEPAISPTGSALIYTTVHPTWSLRRLDPATGEERQLLEKRLEVLFPRISPDGTRVAFFGRDTVGGVQIFTIGADGTGVRQVSEGRDEINTMPTWSGDGLSLYFYRNRPQNSFRRIAVNGGPSVEIAPWAWELQSDADVDPHDNRVAFLDRSQGQSQNARIRQLTTGEELTLPIPIGRPRWSRDGRSVVGYWKGAIHACDADVPNRCESLTNGESPVPSADGSRIFFLRRTSPNNADLWVLDRATKREHRLRTLGPFRSIDVTFDVGPRDQVVWAPYQEGRHELWLADLR
jgi:eukaryotic-like serine/threonine-protein kinase